MGRRWSLRARFALVAMACLLPLLGVVIFVLYQSLGYGRTQLLDAQGTTAEVVAGSLAATIDDNANVLTELAALDAVQQLDPVAANEALSIFRRARPSGLYGLFLVGADGQPIARSGLEDGPLPMGVNGLVKEALGPAMPGVSNLLTIPGADDNVEVIALVAPVRSEVEGEPIGAVGALLAVDRLRNTVLPFARGDAVIAIVAEGQIIAAQAAEGFDESDVEGQLAQPVAAAVGGTIGTHVYRDTAGVERLAAYAPVPGAEWAVLVTQPSPAATALNRTLFEQGLAALALAVLATLVLAVVLSEWIARPLRHLTEQATALARGDFSRRVSPAGGGEVAMLSIAFREMADRLVSQVRDLEKAREAGAAQAVQLRDLNRRTVRLQENERRRIAGDIHDAVAPLITGALYQARALRLGGGNGNGTGNGDAVTAANGSANGHALDAINDLLARSMDELHRVIFALRPPDLDDIGVVAAIERYIAQIQRSGLNCRLEVGDEPPELSPEVRLAIYRIVQEALHNALRHAAADEAIVALETLDGVLRVTVRDNGAGFDLAHAARPTALGLLSMRERAAAIGASFAVTSRPGDGTTVVIERQMEPVPVADEATPLADGAEVVTEPVSIPLTAPVDVMHA